MAQRQADTVTHRATLGIQLLIVRPPRLELGFQHRGFQHLLRRDGVIAHPLTSHAGIALAQNIAQPQLHRRKPHYLCYFIHQGFIGEDDLRRAVTAISRGVVIVGVDAGDIDAHVGNVIGARRLHRAAPGDKHRLPGVAAAIGDDIDLHRLNAGIIIKANAVMQFIGVAFVALAHRLLAVIGHLDRTPRQLYQ